MKFLSHLLYFLMFYLLFTLKGGFLYASKSNCPTLFSKPAEEQNPTTSHQTLKNIEKLFHILISQNEVIREEIKEINIRIRQQGQAFTALSQRLDHLSRQVRTDSNTLGKIIEFLALNSIPDLLRKLEVNIVDSENQILNNVWVNNKNFDILVLEIEPNIGRNKILIIEMRPQIQIKNLSILLKSDIYNETGGKELLESLLRYLNGKMGREIFTFGNTSIHRIIIFRKLPAKQKNNVIKMASKEGILLIRMEPNLTGRTEIIGEINRHTMRDFATPHRLEKN